VSNSSWFCNFHQKDLVAEVTTNAVHLASHKPSGTVQSARRCSFLKFSFTSYEIFAVHTTSNSLQHVWLHLASSQHCRKSIQLNVEMPRNASRLISGLSRPRHVLLQGYEEIAEWTCVSMLKTVRVKYLTQTVIQTFKTNDNGPNEIAHFPDNKKNSQKTQT